jgi:negative regulator of flagellin synthesis FlgM
MRISEIIASLIPRVRPIGPSKGPTEVERAGRIISRPDEVQLSGESQLLSKLAAEMRNLPEIDEAKVAELRARIEAGDYGPSAREIASKILGMDSE